MLLSPVLRTLGIHCDAGLFVLIFFYYTYHAIIQLVLGYLLKPALSFNSHCEFGYGTLVWVLLTAVFIVSMGSKTNPNTCCCFK